MAFKNVAGDGALTSVELAPAGADINAPVSGTVRPRPRHRTMSTGIPAPCPARWGMCLECLLCLTGWLSTYCDLRQYACTCRCSSIPLLHVK